MSDNDDDVGGDIIGAQQGDLVVMRIRDGILPLRHIEQACWPQHLALDRAEGGGRVLQLGKLAQEGGEAVWRLLQGHSIHHQDHPDKEMSVKPNPPARNTWH